MNKGYANSLGEICGNPIQSVDKMHLLLKQIGLLIKLEIFQDILFKGIL
ncbi:MAG: hypothetical protein Q9M97_10415 [Candidatus Gracilibacteria bacterium]|nr:hypothetical protein [Candidatus Gracilibacteria bacterium]MDQ7022895.1 hypothetical protein [Candidatus Gracilibacteria bacterium]MDQ7023029.1 hypothetical protein [Candidatus Gracilibacteria bacterium]MDQ7023872.1 hypothetical protein [Candidatus Gracilibacteria bacterium]